MSSDVHQEHFKTILYEREKGVVSSYAYIFLCKTLDSSWYHKINFMFIYVHVVQWLCIFYYLYHVFSSWKRLIITYSTAQWVVGLLELLLQTFYILKVKNVNPLIRCIGTSVVYHYLQKHTFLLLCSQICVKCMWVTFAHVYHMHIRSTYKCSDEAHMICHINL